MLCSFAKNALMTALPFSLLISYSLVPNVSQVSRRHLACTDRLDQRQSTRMVVLGAHEAALLQRVQRVAGVFAQHQPHVIG